MSVRQAWSAIQQPSCRLQSEVLWNGCQRPSKMRKLILQKSFSLRNTLWGLRTASSSAQDQTEQGEIL